ncbi:MAG: hypothetical protein ACREJ2_06010, partial [Planctomycetota bacterium]
GRGRSGGSRGGWRRREQHRRGESIMVYRRHHAYGSDGKSICLNGPALSVEEAREYLSDFENFENRWWDELPADFAAASDSEMQALEGGSEAIPQGATAMQDESPEESAEPVSLIDMGELPPEKFPADPETGETGPPPLDEVSEEMAAQPAAAATDVDDLFETERRGAGTTELPADSAENTAAESETEETDPNASDDAEGSESPAESEDSEDAEE